MLHAKLRNRTGQGLDRQGQGQGLTSLMRVSRFTAVFFLLLSVRFYHITVNKDEYK